MIPNLTWFKYFLKWLGTKYPDILHDLLNNPKFSNKDKQIIILRYIHKEPFKIISDKVNLTIRQIQKRQQFVLYILYNSIN